MTTVPEEVWKTSSFSESGQDCVEVSNQHRVRDSKNPAGPVLPVLPVSIAALVEALKADRI